MKKLCDNFGIKYFNATKYCEENNISPRDPEVLLFKCIYGSKIIRYILEDQNAWAAQFED